MVQETETVFVAGDVEIDKASAMDDEETKKVSVVADAGIEKAA